jgi:ATP-dependent exoDNAse (exonuclease V) alpha subunit
VTSHSSQGQTADRVLIHVDTELGAKDLLNNRMAYVAVSRGAYHAQLFTNDREKLGGSVGKGCIALERPCARAQARAVHRAPAGDRTTP